MADGVPGAVLLSKKRGLSGATKRDNVYPFRIKSTGRISIHASVTGMKTKSERNPHANTSGNVILIHPNGTRISIGKWSPADQIPATVFPPSYENRSYPAHSTKFLVFGTAVDAPGDWKVSFEYTSGAHALVIVDVYLKILEDHSVLQQKLRDQITKMEKECETFKLEIGKKETEIKSITMNHKREMEALQSEHAHHSSLLKDQIVKMQRKCEMMESAIVEKDKEIEIITANHKKEIETLDSKITALEADIRKFEEHQHASDMHSFFLKHRPLKIDAEKVTLIPHSTWKHGTTLFAHCCVEDHKNIWTIRLISDAEYDHFDRMVQIENWCLHINVPYIQRVLGVIYNPHMMTGFDLLENELGSGSRLALVLECNGPSEMPLNTFLLQSDELLSQHAILSLFKQVCLGIRNLHDCGQWHGNIDSEMIFIIPPASNSTDRIEGDGDDWSVRICEPGMWEEEACDDDRIRYLPPEVISGDGRVSEFSARSYESDVWGLGMVLIELITRKRPFDGISKPSAVSLRIGQCPFNLEFASDVTCLHGSLIEFAKACFSPIPSQRPHVQDLLNRTDLVQEEGK